MKCSKDHLLIKYTRNQKFVNALQRSFIIIGRISVNSLKFLRKNFIPSDKEFYILYTGKVPF